MIDCINCMVYRWVDVLKSVVMMTLPEQLSGLSTQSELSLADHQQQQPTLTEHCAPDTVTEWIYIISIVS